MTTLPKHLTPDVGHLLIHFPCEFTIKVIGIHSADFVDIMVTVIQNILPNFNRENISTRSSQHGKYLSLNCMLWVHSQAELDAVYCAVSTHPAVKFVL